jgi:molecular chaperone DnaK (HSP70)
MIGVPAHFNSEQRAATLLAARIAGFDPIGLVPEPTAAGLHFAHVMKTRLDHSRPMVVFVFDFGGGTLDISIVFAHDGACDVLAIEGDSYLGGDAVDELIVRDFERQLRAERERVEGQTAVSVKEFMGLLAEAPAARARLRTEAKALKERLSKVRSTSVTLPALDEDDAAAAAASGQGQGGGGGKGGRGAGGGGLRLRYERATLARLMRPVLLQLEARIHAALAKAGRYIATEGRMQLSALLQHADPDRPLDVQVRSPFCCHRVNNIV